MKNVLVIDFDDSLSASIERLIREGICSLVDWFGDRPGCTLQPKRELKYSNLKSFKYQRYDKTVYDAVHADFFQYFIFMNRKKKIYAKGYRFYDHLDFFNLYFQFFFNLLTKKKVDIVLFQYLPHLGIDYIVYRIARELKLRTILCYQSLFPNRFFYVEDIEDFGTFETMRNRSTGEPTHIQLPHGFREELFYMKKHGDRLRWGSPRGIKKLLNELKNKRSQLSAFLRYQKRLRRFITHQLDLSAPFVYFPLHLQPELTTSLLGGKYIDQALAIEHLSELLPPDWYIYVKENPKQTSEYLRGTGFFRRLAAIERVRMVPRETDTYSLLEHCRFVATVTGTAGWEAIRGGKKVLVFGKAWYRSLPGAISYRPGIKLEEILAAPLRHEALEQELSKIVTKMPTGVIDYDYRVMVPDFSEEENIRRVFQALSEIIFEPISKTKER